MQKDRQTDMMKLVVTFHKLANMPKNNIWMTLRSFNFYLFYDLRKKYILVEFVGACHQK
jgi:predicted transcriptional regulator